MKKKIKQTYLYFLYSSSTFFSFIPLLFFNRENQKSLVSGKIVYISSTNVTNINNQRRAYYSEWSNRSAIYWKHFAFVTKGFCPGRGLILNSPRARTLLRGIFRMSSISLQISRTHIPERKYLSIFPLYTREPLRNEPGPFLRSRPK